VPVTGFSEFAPDQPPLANVSHHVLNVLPKTPTSYGPVYELEEQGNSISAYCRGADAFRGNLDGTAVNFAGDETHLYLWDGTAWDDVSRTVGGAYATPTDGSWTFEQFNNTVIAANGVDDLQFWSIGSSTNFAALGGAPPVSRYLATVRDFLFAANLTTNTAGVRWSEQFNHAGWTTGQNQSDLQDLPNNGAITGITGGQYAVIFQQHGINLATYVGPDLIFQFDQQADDRGCIAPGSLSTIEQTTFFLDSDGFFRIDGGRAIKSIGAQRVDRTFTADVNRSFLYRITSAIDHDNKIYYISYPSTASSDGTPDSILVYNFEIDRWAKLNFGVDVLWNMYASLGLSLEDLDALYPDLDLMPISLDSETFKSAPTKTFAAFKSTQKLAFFEGDALDAIIDSVEAETNPFGQAEIDRIIPYIDGGTIGALLGRRDRLNDAMTFSSQADQDSFGDIYFREPAARFHRARVLWTPGTGTHAQGIEFQANQAGDR
jgi:hypothetical protein